MKRAARLALGSAIVAGVMLVLFLLPVVPISVQYACEGLANECAQLSYSTFGSVTYALFHAGAVYVRDNTDARFSQYCWMEGSPYSNGAVCSTVTQ